MVEKRLRINPSLYISESEGWVYLSVDDGVYKVKMDEEEKKNLHEVIRHIKRYGKIKEEGEWKIPIHILERIGAAVERIEEKIVENTVRIRKMKYVDNIENLNRFCNGERVSFGEGEEGLFTYLTEDELILAKKEIRGGNFCRPGEKQQQLAVQVILKNAEEILDAMVEYGYLALPLFSYAQGIRILKEELDSAKELVDYVWFQPWNTKIAVDADSHYPRIIVKCVLEGMDFEAIGLDTNSALYHIYTEYESMRKEDGREW